MSTTSVLVVYAAIFVLTWLAGAGSIFVLMNTSPRGSAALMKIDYRVLPDQPANWTMPPDRKDLKLQTAHASIGWLFGCGSMPPDNQLSCGNGGTLGVFTLEEIVGFQDYSCEGSPCNPIWTPTYPNGTQIFPNATNVSLPSSLWSLSFTFGLFAALAHLAVTCIAVLTTLLMVLGCCCGMTTIFRASLAPFILCVIVPTVFFTVAFCITSALAARRTQHWLLPSASCSVYPGISLYITILSDCSLIVAAILCCVLIFVRPDPAPSDEYQVLQDDRKQLQFGSIRT